LSAQQADLTSSAQREARLRGRLESLTSSMGDGLIAVDSVGDIVTFNPAAETLTGRNAQAALGRPLGDVLTGALLEEIAGEAQSDSRPPEDPLGLRNPDGGAPAAARLLLVRTDGTHVPVAATAAPVRSPAGDIIGRVYVLRDISRELEIERMKTEFLANVSHELRTPLTPIKGYAGVLARRDVGPEATMQYAREIMDATRRLERVVGMIVDFAGLDSGQVVLRREPVDLRPLVAETLARWRETHPDRQFLNRSDRSLPPVLGDPDYLRRCLDELLDNAVKFSPDGDAVVVAASGRGAHVQLQVIDAGVGIDHEATQRLFSDFVQADGTETRHFGGLGLGLGLVKRILDGIGADVRVQSEPGRGTTVSLVLKAAGPAPVDPLPPPPIPAPDRPLPSPPQPGLVDPLSAPPTPRPTVPAPPGGC
ncbi:MAG TPA: ATP-binding protein, partial [Euzebya sp.]|nr:ATP-binding protein [Euzebya sp.]